ncbi:MAG: branched-chain amino acid ABC transporter permease [Acidimicrobiales bacterium]
MNAVAAAVTSGYRVRRATTASRGFGVVAVAGIAVLALLPRWGSDSLEQKLVVLFVYIAIAQMWNLLAGFSGLVSIGQQAFFGLGGYGLVYFVNTRGLPLYAAVVPAMLMAAVAAVPIALLAFRLRGGYFAIGTWVIAEVVGGLVGKWEDVGAGRGVTLNVIGYDVAERGDVIYWIALVLAVGAVAIVYGVLVSRLGLALQAIRDDEGGARGLGANVYRSRFAVFVVAALWTGLAGAVYYLQNLRLQPTAAFSVVSWTAPIIFIVVIGGLGTIEGPIVGAVVWFVLREQFADQATWYLVGVGAVAIAVAVFLRRGLWGTLAERFGWRLLPIRRRLELSAERSQP